MKLKEPNELTGKEELNLPTQKAKIFQIKKIYQTLNPFHKLHTRRPQTAKIHLQMKDLTNTQERNW